MFPSISSSTLSSHSSPSSAWVSIHGDVFDVTSFANEHPGGKKILLNMAGKDATAQFDKFHNVATLKKWGPKLIVGRMDSAKGKSILDAQTSSPPLPSSSPSSSSSSSPSLRKKSPAPTAFGSLVPYGEPSWYQSWFSPYYNDSHRHLRALLREFIEVNLSPFVSEWEEKKAIPPEVWRKCGEFGILAAVLGPPWPTEYMGTEALKRWGVKEEEFDYFHEYIIHDELSKMGSGGLVWGLYIGMAIGGTTVFRYGSTEMKEKVCRPVLRGEKLICLAITEPDAGSDVANIKTTATKTPDGKYYIVNGTKKWITNGVWANWFSVAVRTGGNGMGGISMLLMERGPGITTKQMQCMGVWSSGTTFVTFEDVKVPVENLIGKEGEGFKIIMHNFNHERLVVSLQTIRFARVCLEEAIAYSCKRKTFGKLLIEHPVIRMKLANMACRVEATHAMAESIAYQLNNMTYEDGVRILGGPIALLKAQATQTFELCAREAAQVFGGLAYTRGGQGEKVERLYREVLSCKIPAGSEEIMLELGIKQAVRPYLKEMGIQAKL